MLFTPQKLHRVATMFNILERRQLWHPNHVCLRCKSENAVITIADVAKEIKPAKKPEYVPRKYLLKKSSQEDLRHLKWMLQKDILAQDIFLMGGPGKRKRELALAFLELTGRELEFIALSRDTTEADLKQRREIKSGTAYYHDQSAVRAATNGRILVIDGVEKAERNVLPVLNNLLENREMHLEDGRFLVPATRYDKLLETHTQEELDSWRLVRVSEDFRVIALGLPSPKYPGHPLDPPLRSRFQARHVSPPVYEQQQSSLRDLAPNADAEKISQLLSCAHALNTQEATSLGLPDFPLDNLSSAAMIMDKFPALSVFDILYRFYPYKLFLGNDGQTAVEDILRAFNALEKNGQAEKKHVTANKKTNNLLEVTVHHNKSKTTLDVHCGSEDLNENSSKSTKYIETNYQNKLLADLTESHLVSDFCLIGPKGCGKSTTIQTLAGLLGYQVEPIMLYQDMTARDLIQQRTTLSNGDTVWRDSPLVDAAIHGKLAVLDGINRIHPSTLAILHRLVHDREMQLHDGKRLLRADRYDEITEEFGKSDTEMRESGVVRIHPGFRIIALAEPPVIHSSTGQWLNSELLSLFMFHEMRPLEKSEEIHIIRSKYGEPPKALLSIIELAHVLRLSKDPTLQSLAASLTTRQLLRIAERMRKFGCEDAYDAVQRACLARFLPTVAKQALDDTCNRLGIVPTKDTVNNPNITYTITKDTVTIGETSIKRHITTAPSKVPDILFYDVPQHIALLERLLQDFTLGQNVLLVGNQGVGKNKIADRLLQLLNRPREYIQLHRDTTVQTLTLQPMVRDGRVVYEDSPLVQAAKLGHVLVVDEADKAPTYVTCILKTLVESGEMILSDGRRILPSQIHGTQDPNSIVLHPDFRMIVLANRPGFPFLGNDFFGALGDLFSTHAVDNPSVEDEIKLLRQYGPSVDEEIIQKLVGAFDQLRTMADQGLVAYPYSTREVVNIVKHLEKFPNESLPSVVRNVFDFDRHSEEVYETLTNILHKHGIPIGTNPANIALAKEISLPAMKVWGTWTVLNKSQTVHVEERHVKVTKATGLTQMAQQLDRTDARSEWFTEMQKYWTIPLTETGTVAGLAVSKGISKTVLDDKIHILTTNPLSIFTMRLDTNESLQTVIHHVVKSEGGLKPQYTIATDNDQNVLVHVERTNNLLFINTVDGTARTLKFSSILDAASDRLTRLKQNNVHWKMMTDLIPSQNQIIFFTQNNSRIEIVDLKSMCAYSFNLPFDIKSILIGSDSKWLIQDTKRGKHMFSKSTDTMPFPNVLQEIQESTVDVLNCGTLLSCGTNNLSSSVISSALNQKINSPSRLLVTDNSYGGIAVGFPDLDSLHELHFWPRGGRSKSTMKPIVVENGDVIRTVASSDIPEEVYREDSNFLAVNAYFEIVDVGNCKLRYIPIPDPVNLSSAAQWLYGKDVPIYTSRLSNEGLVSVDAGGCIRLWETATASIERSLDDWQKMVGGNERPLQITKERYSGLDVSAPKHGKVDEKNEPHVGGNTWAGGTGGRDTAGLGGKGGPYRLDAGHAVHQLSDEEKHSVPEHVKKAAREMGQRAFKQRLRDIRMSEYDHKLYSRFSDVVHKQVQALRVIIGSLHTKSKERQWCRHQTSGELDDTKLIEGLTGERTIYRRRAEKDPEIGAPALKPKYLRLVVDVSGSMYRFNGYDGRLDRELEACTMVMEAFNGYESKFKYDIIGHSGDDYNIPFVHSTQPPTDNKRRLEVIKTMYAHSQFCISGDHTLEATQFAITNLAKEETDESIVIVLSDANLERYGIQPQVFTKVLVLDSNVNAFAIFIGSLGDQADRLIKQMPSGRAFVCMDLKDIPRIMQQIFSASLLSTTQSS